MGDTSGNNILLNLYILVVAKEQMEIETINKIRKICSLSDSGQCYEEILSEGD